MDVNVLQQTAKKSTHQTMEQAPPTCRHGVNFKEFQGPLPSQAALPGSYSGPRFLSGRLLLAPCYDTPSARFPLQTHIITNGRHEVRAQRLSSLTSTGDLLRRGFAQTAVGPRDQEGATIQVHIHIRCHKSLGGRLVTTPDQSSHNYICHFKNNNNNNKVIFTKILFVS